MNRFVTFRKSGDTMSQYTVETIYERGHNDPAAFVTACEQTYHDKVAACAKTLVARASEAPIVLLAGPSGSGKTTTAIKLSESLAVMGHRCYTVSMDDYYKTVGDGTHPTDAHGNIDFESPYCLDLELFNQHLHDLRLGKTIQVPHFDFPNQRRDPEKTTPLTLEAGGFCIFEGIHALNPLFSQSTGNAVQRVYVSARSNIKMEGAVFKATWVRLLRRMIRDKNFRGWAADRTFTQWGSVRRGEKRYISPFKEGAYSIDTHMPYEVCIYRDIALPALLAEVPSGVDRHAEITSIYALLAKFPSLPPSLLPPNSLLHEFLG